ncbi:polar amino acid transport system permease protein [Bradyrhizobium sp. CIR48]|nr:polar amino acid transport system permease protein [Bradyrhizobium sp. CIR48]
MRALSHSYVEFVRGTPLLVQLYFVFYVLPDIGILLSPLTAGVATLGIHYATYTSEVYRAGIDNVDRALWEAAKALNLTRLQTWRYVIIPLAVPPMLPALCNYVVSMFKETPLLSTITVIELMAQARIIANVNYRYVEPMTMVGVFFLAVSIPSVIALQYLERHYGTGRDRHRNMSIF